MTETQVLFRVDADLLKELDSSISDTGFKTRNEWFRNVVRDFLEEAERRKLLRKLERLKIKKMSDDEIAAMVRAWRAGKN